jgi:serine/threonine protein kinase
MGASEENKCQRCGAVVPATSTEKLCPACLLSGALTAPGGQAETVAMAPGASPSFEAPADFPCEFGGYRLLGMLGRGGMGTVYEAEDLATGRRVALKMLGQELDSPEMRQRFLREGRLAASVNHPNSLFVFGSQEIEGLPVITMEIAGAGTLKDELKQRGPLPVPEAVDAVLDVISGLESAFVAGVLHRDIKPSNCFVCPDGSVKVGDFGLSVSTLAKTDTFVTAHGKIMGTPAYASPEQLRGDDLDVRADIYSVGATLFTLVTDRAPFEGDNAVQVVANAVNQEPPPLTELRQDVPPALERVVARCLAKEPTGRYAGYTALRNALLPFSSREPARVDAAAGIHRVDRLPDRFSAALRGPDVPDRLPRIAGSAACRPHPGIGEVLLPAARLRVPVLHDRRGDLGRRHRQVAQGASRDPRQRPPARRRKGAHSDFHSHRLC